MNPVGRVRRSLATLASQGRGPLIASVALGWLVTLGMRFVVPALLPNIKAAFAVDNATAGLAVTLIWVTYGLMQFPAGALVDRVGERLLLTASLVAAAAGVVAFSLTPVFALFLLACAVFGLGTGLFGPPRATVLTRTYPENDGAAFGLVLAAGSVGAAALPVAASLLVDSIGWRGTLGLAGPAFLALAAATWWAVPERDRAADAPNRSAGETARAVYEAVSRRSVVVAIAAISLALFAFQGLTAFYVTYLVDDKGLSQPMAASLFALLFLAGAGFQSAAGGAADRFGYDRVLVALAAGSVLPLVALPLVDGVLPLAAVTVGIALRMAIGPVSNAYVVRILHDDVQGVAWGLLRTVFFLIGSSGSWVIGVLADRGLFDVAFWLLAALTAVTAGLYLLLPSRAAASGSAD